MTAASSHTRARAISDRLARATPLGLMRSLEPGQWLAPAHLRYIQKRIIAGIEGHPGAPRRFVVSMPSRHGKSQTISHALPTWYLDRYPDRNVMLGSNEATFAATWSGKVRDTIEQHAGELSVRIRQDSRARNEWSTTAGGGMIARGVGGSFIGRGADLLIVDDPFKDGNEAQSPTARERVWSWWITTAQQRLDSPDAVAVVVMTRWHDDDLVGRILDNARDGGEEWEYIRIPALADSERDILGREIGEAIWPERWPRERLEAIRDRMPDPWVWFTMYQQKPTPSSGLIHRAIWFEGQNRYDPALWEHIGRVTDLYLFFDTAHRTEETSSWSAAVLLGLTPEGRVLVLDVERDRLAFPDLVEFAERKITEAYKWGRGGLLRDVVVEDAASGISLLDTMRAGLRHGEDDYIVGWNPRQSKDDRGRAASFWLKNGMVWLPTPSELAPWRHEFERELFGIPATRYRDMTDALHMGILYLENYIEEGFEALGGYEIHYPAEHSFGILPRAA